MSKPDSPDAASASTPPADSPAGFEKGLTSYGDRGFSLFLRKAFIKGAGYTRQGARPARDRHRQQRQRVQPLSRQRAAADRGGQARRHAGGRPADGLPHDLHPRELRGADEHVSAQPHVDRHRGDDPRPADGRGGADRRLRQDGAGAADGRGLGGLPAIAARHRLDAHRLASRRARRRVHRLPPLLGPLPRRRDRRRGDRRRQQPARRERRHLLGHGHGEHDGVHRRSARHDGTRRRIAARRHRRPHPHRRADRHDRGSDRARPPHHRQGADARCLRERACACCSPSAAPPTASSISPRSPGGWGSTST